MMMAMVASHWIRVAVEELSFGSIAKSPIVAVSEDVQKD
jgi:hypothetical protein